MRSGNHNGWRVRNPVVGIRVVDALPDIVLSMSLCPASWQHLKLSLLSFFSLF